MYGGTCSENKSWTLSYLYLTTLFLPASPCPRCPAPRVSHSYLVSYISNGAKTDSLHLLLSRTDSYVPSPHPDMDEHLAFSLRAHGHADANRYAWLCEKHFARTSDRHCGAATQHVTHMHAVTHEHTHTDESFIWAAKWTAECCFTSHKAAINPLCLWQLTDWCYNKAGMCVDVVLHVCVCVCALRWANNSFCWWCI